LFVFDLIGYLGLVLLCLPRHTFSRRQGTREQLMLITANMPILPQIAVSKLKKAESGNFNNFLQNFQKNGQQMAGLLRLRW
jgi:hypothetical protein